MGTRCGLQRLVAAFCDRSNIGIPRLGVVLPGMGLETDSLQDTCRSRLPEIADWKAFDDIYGQWIGTHRPAHLFLNLIKMVIAPLIFAIIVSGITGMTKSTGLGPLFAKAITWFLAFSTSSSEAAFPKLIDAITRFGVPAVRLIRPPHGLLLQPRRVHDVHDLRIGFPHQRLRHQHRHRAANRHSRLAPGQQQGWSTVILLVPLLDEPSASMSDVS